jgi:hypothetical protein
MKVKSYVISSFASFILGGDIFDRVRATVARQEEKLLSGPEKRHAAVEELKVIGLELADWAVNLAIELAVACLRSQVKK